MHTEQLALFSTPPTNSGVERIQWIEYRPISQSMDSSSVEFNISGNSVQYVDLSRTQLHVKVKIDTVSGEKPAPTDSVAFVNLPLHSLWSQVDVFLQQQATSMGTGSNYPLKSYLESLLFFGEDCKESTMTAAGYYADNGNMDSTDCLDGSNMGLVQRWGFTAGGAICDLAGPLHADLCQQKRYILNGVAIGIKLWRSKDAFCLMSNHDDKQFKVSLADVYLKVCKVNVSPQVMVAHNAVLAKMPAKYPYHRTDVKVYTVPAGQYDASLDDVFQGAIPTRLIVGLLSAQAYSGHLRKNPFRFQHYDTSLVALYCDGESVPAQPLKLNFEANQYIEGYQALLAATGRDMYDVGNEIDRAQYKNGNTLFGFLVDPTAPEDLQYWPLPKRGHTRLEFKFAKALPESINLVLYATFPAILEIDGSRNIVQ